MTKHIKRIFTLRKAYRVVVAIAFFCAVMSFAVRPDTGISVNETDLKDSIASVTAFMDVYKVLMSPRCMNCHPSGDVPLQGDDSHLHNMLPERGKDGKGVYAMKCSNCHQPSNLEGVGMPPGHPDWHLPPADMKMVFQGKSPRELALQLVNPKTNGNKNLTKLLEHANDGLVKIGWDMGEGRAAPPLSYAAFKTAWTTWIENGAYAPAETAHDNR